MSAARTVGHCAAVYYIILSRACLRVLMKNLAPILAVYAQLAGKAATCGRNINGKARCAFRFDARRNTCGRIACTWHSSCSSSLPGPETAVLGR